MGNIVLSAPGVAIGAAIGLGSNVGNRQEYLQQAIARLTDETCGILHCDAVSSVYENPAMLPENAPPEWNTPFLNCVLVGQPRVVALEALRYTQALEKQLGRQDRGRWGPREIDIDLLIWGEEQMDADTLTIPHPGIASRDFVLVPLAEALHSIEQDWVIPGTATQIRAAAKQCYTTTLQRIGVIV